VIRLRRDRDKLEPALRGPFGLVREAEDLEPAAAGTGERFELLDWANGLEGRSAAGIAAEESSSDHHRFEDGQGSGRNAAAPAIMCGP
jgi:hypothetical protein